MYLLRHLLWLPLHATLLRICFAYTGPAGWSKCWYDIGTGVPSNETSLLLGGKLLMRLTANYYPRLHVQAACPCGATTTVTSLNA